MILTHASGHATIANAKAMALGGVTRRTANPPGGLIVRDEKGNPTGVFKETAAGLVRRPYAATRAARTPEQVNADADREIEAGDREFLSKGVTTVHDAGASLATIDRYRRFTEGGRLGVRLYVMVESIDRYNYSPQTVLSGIYESPSGSVVDFLNVGLGSLRTGIFNVADVAITLGLALVVVESWLSEPRAMPRALGGRRGRDGPAEVIDGS